MLGTRRLSRYVLSELAAPTLLSIALWSSLLLMNSFFTLARVAIQKDLSFETTFRMLALYIPETLVLALPMGTLLGTLVGIGRLSADHEFTALQGAGLGPGFLLRPVLLHGVLFTAAAIALYGWVYPVARYEIRTVQAHMITAANMTTELQPRVFFDRLPGTVVYVNEIPAGTRGTLDGVLVYQADVESGFEQLIVAHNAFVMPGDAPGSAVLDLRNGVLHVFKTTDPTNYRPSTFEQYIPRPVVPPSYMLGTDKPIDRAVGDMLPGQLARELKAAPLEKDPIIRGYRVRMSSIEANARLALPFACLCFAVLALPLGVTQARSGKGAGFAISLAIIVVYWVVYTSLRTRATDGHLPVPLAMWTANLVMVVWAVVAYRRFARSASDSRGMIRRGATAIMDLLPSFRTRREAAEVGAETAAPTTVAFAYRPGSRLVAILDAYIGRLYLRLLVLALAFSTLIFVLVEMKDVFEKMAPQNHAIGPVIAYLGLFAPGSLPMSVPISCLIGAVITFTLLGRSGELTAIKAGGMSMRRATIPVFAVTAVVCGLTYLVDNNVAPETNRSAQALRDEIQGRTPRTYGVVPGGRWTFGSAGRLYHYRLYDPVLQEFQGLSVVEVDFARSRILSHRFASTAKWNGATWIAKGGWSRTFPEGGAVGPFKTYSGEAPIDLDPPDNFARREMTLVQGGDLPDQMSVQELGDQIATLAASGYDTTRLRVDWHAKIARSTTPLVMVLLGLPFAFKVGRRGSLYGVGVALILAIVYWAAFAVSNALGLETLLPPVLAAWAPNVLFAGFGAYLMLYIKT